MTVDVIDISSIVTSSSSTPFNWSDMIFCVEVATKVNVIWVPVNTLNDVLLKVIGWGCIPDQVEQFKLEPTGKAEWLIVIE